LKLPVGSIPLNFIFGGGRSYFLAGAGVLGATGGGGVTVLFGVVVGLD